MQSKASFVVFVTMRISSVLVSLAVWSVDFAKWSDPTTNKEHGMEFSEIPFSMLFFHMWGTFRQNSNRITQQSWVSSDGTNHRKAKEFTCRDVVGKVPDWGGVKLESGNCLHVFFPSQIFDIFWYKSCFLQCLVMIYCLKHGRFWGREVLMAKNWGWAQYWNIRSKCSQNPNLQWNVMEVKSSAITCSFSFQRSRCSANCGLWWVVQWSYLNRTIFQGRMILPQRTLDVIRLLHRSRRFLIG